MPTQSEIEEIRQSQLVAITGVMSRYPSARQIVPVIHEEPGSVLVSPFGPVTRPETTKVLTAPHPVTQQPIKGEGNPEAGAGIGYSVLALLAGLIALWAYFRKILE
jgi:hypothetical protein